MSLSFDTRNGPSVTRQFSVDPKVSVSVASTIRCSSCARFGSNDLPFNWSAVYSNGDK